MSISCFPKRTLKDFELGDVGLGFGENVAKFESEFRNYSNKIHNIGVCSGSAAAYCIFAYLKYIFGNCNVYVPINSFISPVWAARQVGHRIHYIKVDNNLLFDSCDYVKYRKNDKYLFKRPAILLLLLYGGVEEIQFECELFGDEIIVTDSAHCVRPDATQSYFIFSSFYPTKPICMSYGGMISTNSYRANEFFRIYRNFGRIPDEDTYKISPIGGFKFYMDNINATIGLQSLTSQEKNIEKRRENYCKLYDLTNGLKGIKCIVDQTENSTYYLFTVLLRNPSSREIRQHMRNQGIETTYHYPILNHTRLFEGDLQDDQVINLPIHEDLREDDIIRIADSFKKALKTYG